MNKNDLVNSNTKQDFEPIVDAVILIHIPVTNLINSVEFYVNLLGFELEYPERPIEDSTFFKVKNGGARFVLHQSNEKHHLHWLNQGQIKPAIEMHSKNIEELYRKLKLANVDVTNPRYEEHCGGYITFFDPDGHYILVNQDLKYYI